MSAPTPPPATETDWLSAYLDAANRLSRAHVDLRDLRRENDRLREELAEARAIITNTAATVQAFRLFIPPKGALPVA